MRPQPDRTALARDLTLRRLRASAAPMSVSDLFLALNERGKELTVSDHHLRRALDELVAEGLVTATRSYRSHAYRGRGGTPQARGYWALHYGASGGARAAKRKPEPAGKGAAR